MPHTPRRVRGTRGSRSYGATTTLRANEKEKERRGGKEVRVRESERRRGELERRSGEKRTKVSRKSKCESSPGAGIGGWFKGG